MIDAGVDFAKGRKWEVSGLLGLLCRRNRKLDYLLTVFPLLLEGLVSE